MTELVDYQLNDGVATITITNGKANALSHDVFEGLHWKLSMSPAARLWIRPKATKRW